MVIDKKIRERKSLGSFRLDFKWQAEKGKCVLQRVADAEVDCLSVLYERKLCLFFSFRVCEIHIRFEHTCYWLIAF